MRRCRGNSLVLAVAFLAMVCALMTGAAAVTRVYLRHSQRQRAVVQARWLAESAAQRAYAILRTLPDFAGETAHPLGPGSISSRVSRTGRSWQIEARGEVAIANAGPTVVRAVRVQVARSFFGGWRIVDWQEVSAP